MSAESSQPCDGDAARSRVVSALPTEDGQKRVLIGTHDGTFHCDEVLACYLLRQLPDYADAWIVRTRNPTLLAECDVVVDVGAEFDPARHRYDHHQRGFEQTFASLRPDMKWVMKLSSAGLVYVHFGQRILQHMTQLPEDSKLLKALYEKLYDDFIQEIDAIDNGVSVSDGEMRYRITTSLSSRVGYLNPWWNSAADSDLQNARFVQAMELVGREFRDRLDFFTKCWWPARAHVASALAGRAKVHASGRIMVLGQGGVPWKSHLFELEQEDGIAGKILFVLFEDQSGKWRVQAVPLDQTRAFENRLSLPEAWRGLRDERLAEAAGVDGAVFVHASGFMGGCASFEGALAMAEKAIARMEEAKSATASVD